MPSVPSSPARLHHVGFVVASIAEALPDFISAMGARWSGQIYEDPLQRVKVTFLETDARDAQFELVEPDAPDSPVARFLSDGGGLHHLCYEVDAIDDHLARLREKRCGVLVSRPKPAVAFGGRRIAWFYTSRKLLLEFLERG